MVELHKDLTALGNSAVNKPLYEQSGVNPGLLEKFPNPYKVDNRNKVLGTLHIELPEFTSVCPRTLQPDSGNIIIDYTPDEFCVESKALKLYMFSFRNQGAFMESIVNIICNDLVELLQPIEIKVEGRFAARGGIPLYPTATWKKEKIVQPVPFIRTND